MGVSARSRGRAGRGPGKSRAPVLHGAATPGPRPPPPGEHPGGRCSRGELCHGQRPGVALLGQEHDLDQRSSAGEHAETRRSGESDPARRRGRALGQPQDRADARQGPRPNQGPRRGRHRDSFGKTRAQALKVRALRENASLAQRGFALIALLALAALISAFLIATALNLTSAGISNEREDRSMSALRQAKAALIAYAASEQWQAYKGQEKDQPGALPCPDSNDTGASAGVCSGAANRVGRLPWATIGSTDFRDASGERLWYAVSSSFYKNSANIINSDTQGLLTVAGAAPASNVVAIVFAPGEALSGQDRIAQHNLPAACLEGFTAASPDYTFKSVATPSSTANDRMLVITQ